MRRSTILLSLLAIVAVFGAVLLERVAPADGAAATRGAGVSRVFAGDDAPRLEDVAAIELERDGEPPLRLERDEAGAWWQRSPFDHPLVAFSVQAMITAAAQLEQVDALDANRLEESGLGLADLGLDPPAARLRLHGAERTWDLALGRRGIGGRAYARLGDGPVLVVEQSLHDRALGMDPREWRDRRLFIAAGVESDRVLIDRADGVVELRRDGRRWLLEQPVRARTNPAALDGLLQGLGRAQSAGFVVDEPEDLGDFGLAEPAGRVAVWSTLPDGAGARTEVEETLIVGGRMGAGTQDRFGMVVGRPVVLRIPEAVLRAFFGPVEGLCAMTATGIEPADVKLLRISGGAGEFRLERRLDGWQVAGEGGAPVPPEPVERLLRLLARVQADEVVIGDWPRDLEVGMITLYGFDRRPSDAIRIGRDPESKRWFTENGDGVLRLLAPGAEIPLAPAAYGVAAEAAGP